MKLPNGHRALVDVRRKLIGYCLNRSHRTGRHKARVFRSALGITNRNARVLADALLRAARESEARIKHSSDDAVKYEIEFTMVGPHGQRVVRRG